MSRPDRVINATVFGSGIRGNALQVLVLPRSVMLIIPTSVVNASDALDSDPAPPTDFSSCS